MLLTVNTTKMKTISSIDCNKQVYSAVICIAYELDTHIFKNIESRWLHHSLHQGSVLSSPTKFCEFPLVAILGRCFHFLNIDKYKTNVGLFEACMKFNKGARWRQTNVRVTKGTGFRTQENMFSIRIIPDIYDKILAEIKSLFPPQSMFIIPMYTQDLTRLFVEKSHSKYFGNTMLPFAFLEQKVTISKNLIDGYTHIVNRHENGTMLLLPKFIITCVNNYSSEPYHMSMSIYDMRISTFTCTDAWLIPSASKCDGREQCPDGSDEANCTQLNVVHASDTIFNCTGVINNPPLRQYFLCRSKTCILLSYVCDSRQDCADGSDEENCPLYEPRFEKSRNTLQYTQHVVTNLTMAYTCHYEGDDKSYYTSLCKNIGCPYGYKCRMSYCVPLRKVCDGHHDCPHGEDEGFCTNLTCPGMLRCFNSSVCLPPWNVCDGISDCPLYEDEIFCPTKCPKHCSCDGFVHQCDASKASLKTLSNLYVRSLYLNARHQKHIFAFLHALDTPPQVMHLSLVGCYLRAIHYNTNSILNAFVALKHLDLSNNSLSVWRNGSVLSRYLSVLILKMNCISVVEKYSFKGLVSLNILDLSSNRLSTICLYYFEYSHNLTHLHLQDNTITNIEEDTFQSLVKLNVLHADSSFICCFVPVTTDCTHLFGSTSCDNLFDSALVRSLMIFHILTTMPNFIAIVIFLKYRLKDEFLEMELAFAHFLVCAYLFVMSVTDFANIGQFRHLIINFHSSVLCLVPAMISWVSLEWSLCTYATIAFLRMIRTLTLHKHNTSTVKMVNYVIGSTIIVFGLVLTY